MKKYLKEATIPSSYDFYHEDEGPLRYLTNFAAYEMKNGRKMVKIEDIEQLENLTFEGILISPPSDKKKQKCQVILNRTENYSFDYGSANEKLKGIWILTSSGVFYKLMEPDPSYKDLYELFFTNSTLWIELYPLLIEYEEVEIIVKLVKLNFPTKQKLKEKFPKFQTVLSENKSFFMNQIQKSDEENNSQIEKSKFVEKFLKQKNTIRKEVKLEKKKIEKKVEKNNSWSISKVKSSFLDLNFACTTCSRRVFVEFRNCSKCNNQKICTVCLEQPKDQHWICNQCKI
jgi:hypothetical protein